MNNIDPEDIKIKIKIPKESGALLAQASITLFDCWTEHGWRIMSSDHLHPILQEYVWIQSPCFRAGTAWKEMVFIDNLKLYERLQEKIYDSYRLEKAKHPTDTVPSVTNTDLSKDISDEIPF